MATPDIHSTSIEMTDKVNRARTSSLRSSITERTEDWGPDTDFETASTQHTERDPGIFIEQPSRRRRKFRGRHVQMMALGCLLLSSILIGRCPNWYWNLCSIHKGTILGRPYRVDSGLSMDRYIGICRNSQTLYWETANFRLLWGKWYLFSRFLEQLSRSLIGLWRQQ